MQLTFSSLFFLKDADQKAAAATDGQEEQLPHEASSTAVESLPESKVIEMNDKASEETPEIETASGQEFESAADPAPKRKAVRGRQAKNLDAKSAEEQHKEGKMSEDPVVPVSVRGRRGKQAEATAPPAVRQTTRGRNAKAAESANVDMETEKVEPQPAKVALKPRRGRAAKAAASDQTEVAQDIEAPTVTEPLAETAVSQEANEEVDSPEKVVVKPRRGRRPAPSVQKKQEEVQPAPAEDLPLTERTKGVTFLLLFTSLSVQNLESYMG